MRNQYVIDIEHDGGTNYSTIITDDEWNAFIFACKGKLDGWVVPLAVLEEIWVPEYINKVDRVTVRKV